MELSLVSDQIKLVVEESFQLESSSMSLLLFLFLLCYCFTFLCYCLVFFNFLGDDNIAYKRRIFFSVWMINLRSF
jgi:hypothetical protein